MLRDRNKDSDAITIALRALTFQLTDNAYRDRFLAQSGVAPEDLAQLVRDPAFLAGALDMMLRDGALLLAFCDSAGLEPSAVEEAGRALSPVAHE